MIKNLLIATLCLTSLLGCSQDINSVNNDYDNVESINKSDIKKTNKVAQLWLNDKSDSLSITEIKLKELEFNPDEATMQIVDKYEEEKNTMSNNKKNELINEIEKSGFYFIHGTYINKITNKKHTIEFAYNLNKKIRYVYIKEVENKDNFYFENLINWNKDK